MTSKFALVIANTEYQDASFAKLTAPSKDAEEFAQVLKNPELAAFDDVQVLINEGEGKTRRSIARFFAERKHDDLLLFYFSGHGVRNEQGHLFLAANDTELNILEATGISAEFVAYAMNNSRSQRQLLILDCCNSGAFAYGGKSVSAIGKSMGIATAFEGNGFGRVVLTASDAAQFTWEGDKVIGDTQTSLFTHFLIEGLKGEADRDGDGRIHVEELYDYAYEQVVRRTPKQTPYKWSYRQQGDIVLRDNLKLHDVKPSSLPPGLLDLLSHSNSGVRKVGVQDLISLLEGKHLGLARAAEEKLRDIADNDDSLALRNIARDELIARGFPVSRLISSIQPPGAAAHVEKSKPDKSKKKISSESTKPLGEYVTKNREISEKQSVTSQRKLVSVHERSKKVARRDLRDMRDILLEQKKFPFKLTPSLIAASLAITMLSIWLGLSIFNNRPIVTLTPATNSVLPLTTSIPRYTKTAISFPTQTSVPPTPRLGIGSNQKSEKDGMTLLYVPAGEFTMGDDNGELDEKPAHTVDLNSFWIDKTEVTNKMYSLCEKAGVCKEPTDKKSYSHSSYYGNSDYDDYPVIFVNWSMAKVYCEWADRRLPTEAEWEKVARGPNGNTYPWGNTFDGNRLNFCDLNCGFVWANRSFADAWSDVGRVGSYPFGRSIYGALDLLGNVSEWVNDWYSPSVYSHSPSSNPQGPDSGRERVFRGGSWLDEDKSISSIARRSLAPTDMNSYNFIGFRCAISATP